MEQEQRKVCFDEELGIEAYHFKGIMQKFPNHFHKYYVIGFIQKGTRHLSCKNKEYDIQSGNIVLFNPLDNHTCEQIGESTLDYRCININPEVMKKTVFDITGCAYLPEFIETVPTHGDYVALLGELHQMIMGEQESFQKEEAFYFLIEQLLSEYTRFSPVKTVSVKNEIQKVCQYIEENFLQRITLDDLSDIAQINKFTLLRNFTKQYGVTPYQYLEAIRVSHAKQLLETGMELVEAAADAGFADQSHFTKFFKNFIGLTPKQYQRIFTEANR